MWCREARKINIEKQVAEVHANKMEGRDYKIWFYSKRAEYVDLENEDK